jgi:hypothetical protein
MFWTNVFLGLAFLAMIAGFVWLFRDGEGPAPRPGIMRKRGPRANNEESGPDQR